jgi:hypothetical protein
VMFRKRQGSAGSHEEEGVWLLAVEMEIRGVHAIRFRSGDHRVSEDPRFGGAGQSEHPSHQGPLETEAGLPVPGPPRHAPGYSLGTFLRGMARSPTESILLTTQSN